MTRPAAARPTGADRPGSGADPDRSAVLAAQLDHSAFAVLYRRYLDRVYGYAFYVLGDHHDAEDATERTFLAALAGIDAFRETGSSFRAWLFRIAHNTIANALRSRRRRATTSLVGAPEPVATGPDPAAVLTRAEDMRRVRRALASLPDDRRQVVILRFVDGLPAREIGIVLDRSEGAVRVLLHRALRELAVRLDA